MRLLHNRGNMLAGLRFCIVNGTVHCTKQQLETRVRVLFGQQI
jgi:hypothetical protein